MTVKICLLKSNNDFDLEYTYIVPEALASEIDVGVFVAVPFGRGNSVREGLVVSVEEYLPEETPPEKGQFKLKEIKDVIRSRERLSPELAELCRKIQKRYLCSYGSAVSLMMPPELPKKKTVKTASLSVSKERVGEILGSNELRGIKQLKCLEVLADSEEGALPFEELQRIYDIAPAVINNLVKKGYLQVRETEDERVNTKSERKNAPEEYPEKKLNEEQSAALEKIKECMNEGRASGLLLHGITGSGKTEVYLRAIKEAVSAGGSAIMLVPEISLTPQITARFKGRFGGNVAVLHSRLTAAQRRNEYERIKSGQVNIVIGARSAVFAPCENLKLIILDEEQEPSYKSFDSAPYYSADEAAFMRAEICNCAVVLGSATPRVSTYYKAETGLYRYAYMGKRASAGSLPDVCTVNMRKEKNFANRPVFSQLLLTAMKNNYEAGKQTVLFVQRRGFAGRMVCAECGKAMVCKKCRVPMTYHKKAGRLVCHYCGNTVIAPKNCPSCGAFALDSKSVGTEMAETEIKKYFPDADVIRMDADTTGTRDGHRALLERFERENVPFLIGTQMIAKGLDFPNVTLVGVVNADGLLNIQEYNARERTFQLLTQVFGRAGRSDAKGIGILQTMQEDEPVYEYAINQDYGAFYRDEISFRKMMEFPPFASLCTVTVSSADDKAAFALAAKLRHITEKTAEQKKLSGEILSGKVYAVTRAAAPKINDRYRWTFTVRTETFEEMNGIMRTFAYDTMGGLSSKEKALCRVTFDIECS